MNSKILILSIAVISVGLFAMPSTLSLFAGQHTFINGSSVDCKKCHQDIYNELTTGGSTAHLTTQLQACQGCHKTGNITQVIFNSTQNMTWFNTSIKGNANAHAAVTLECVSCHQGVGIELSGSQEAHTQFYWNSSNTINSSVGGVNAVNNTVISLRGANTACVGCHTHITTNVTWIRTKGYNMVANESTGAYNITFSMNTTTNNIQTNYSAGQ